ncbi:DUF3644 domain-containing protein [Adhaeribacter rhizoryzae]|uniref:DUF3644 domain-containing protein n=1 Tax=Adhaeribacter rhizoryzae TaxID=2607907 RepID=A0A5M6D2F8_9BACT|nr:DUF3644 domain-containing protein [Adhaeribacter rhizoryzae]KAA5541641.1 hypothetical protein F0145_20745 [Adhaeribacter rhizoryzae]
MDNCEINFKTSANILDNAFDLLHPTIEILKRNEDPLYIIADDKELKAALITITTSVELLLKSKIASIDWKKLFYEPSKADTNKLLNGDFKSLNFEKCLAVIESISPIKPSHKRDIEIIRKIRNKIIHFHSNIEKKELVSLISVGLDIFIEFYRTYILSSFCEDQDRTKDIDNRLKYVKEYVSTRLLTLKEKYKTFNKPKTFYFSECNNCLQDAFILKNNNTVKCIFCNYESDIKWIAEFHSKFNGLTKICPKCTFHSMCAIHSKEDKEEAWDCVVCGHFINRPKQWNISIQSHLLSANSLKEEFKNTPIEQNLK